MDAWNTILFPFLGVGLLSGALAVSFTECITADGSENPARKPVEVGS